MNLRALPQSFRPLVDLPAAANLLSWIVRPFAAADVRASFESAGFARVVDLSIAANEVLGIVGFAAATHEFAVVLDLQVTSAADGPLGIVRLRAAA